METAWPPGYTKVVNKTYDSLIKAAKVTRSHNIKLGFEAKNAMMNKFFTLIYYFKNAFLKEYLQ